MTAPTLLGVRDRAVAHVRAALPGLAECREYRGEFAAAEVVRVSFNVPAVWVDFGATETWSPSGEPDASGAEAARWDTVATYHAYVAASRLEGQDVLPWTEAVARAIAGQRWGLTDCSSAVISRVENRYSIPGDDRGVEIHSITWRQPLRLGAAPLDTGEVPTTVYLGQVPEIGIGHEDDYEQVAP